ncbi:MAG: four helix bundle protein [Deltaproteobacteria bacterium]|nr:four helix bundle protein [Deltaproteobacteria bacterium]
MKIERFEDLECWQEARKLANMIYNAVERSRKFQKDFRFTGQITSASVSLMSNIAEGFGRRFNKEFVQYLFVSQGSAAEIQSQAYLALDQSYISKEEFQKMYKQAEIVSKLNSGLISYLLKNINRQSKQGKPSKQSKPGKPS